MTKNKPCYINITLFTYCEGLYLMNGTLRARQCGEYFDSHFFKKFNFLWAKGLRVDKVVLFVQRKISRCLE